MKKRPVLMSTLGVLIIAFLVVLIPYLIFRLQPAVESHVLSGNEKAAKTLDLSQPFTVGVYNIAHGRGGDIGQSNWTEESEQVRAERLRQLGELSKPADILILNECDFGTSWSHEVNQYEILAGDNFTHAVTQANYQARLLHRTWRFGNVVLSRFAPTKMEFVQFEPMKQYEQTLAGNHDAVLVHFQDVKGKELRVLAVHLEVRSEETRVAAAKKILEIEADDKNSPLIVAGDCNSTPKGMQGYVKDESGVSALDLLLASGKFTSAIPLSDLTPTYPTANNIDPKHGPRRIDWILIPAAWKVSAHCVESSPLSDHAFISAEVSSP